MLLELRNIKKYFPIKGGLFKPSTDVKAVNDVDLMIKKEENMALVGESGSGKTTLGRIIIKLLPADSGRTRQRNLNRPPARSRRREPMNPVAPVSRII